MLTILLLSTIQLAMSVAIGLKAYRSSRPLLAIAPAIAAAVSFLPAIAAFFSVFIEPDFANSIDGGYAITGLMVTLVYNISWILGYFVFFSSKKKMYAAAEPGKLNPIKPSVLLLVFLIIVMVAWGLLKLAGPSTYASSESLLSGESSRIYTEIKLPGPVLYLVVMIDSFAAPIAAIVMAIGLLQFRPILLVAGAGSLAVLSLVGMSAGSRGGMLLPMAMVAIVFWAMGGRKLFISTSITMVIMAIVMSAVILTYRSSRLAQQRSILDRVFAVVEAATDKQANADSKKGSWQMVGNRLEMLTNTGVLCNYIDRHGYAYFVPYYGVMASYIPRMVWPDKPTPGSYDGTPTGLARFIAQRERVGYMDAGNTALVLTGAADQYMQGGWLGVVLGGMIVGFMFRQIAFWGERNGWFGLLVILRLCDPVWGNLLSLDRLLLIMAHQIMPVFIAYLIIGFLTNRKQRMDMERTQLELDQAASQEMHNDTFVFGR